jgi:23S rRNA pseudouridine2605 synthase
MHPRYGLAKEYEILTPQKPSDIAMQNVRAGTAIDGKIVVPEEFRVMRETTDAVLLSIVVHEGLNKVVRRIMEAAEIPVTRLRRVRIGPLSLAGIPRGAHREMTEGELQSLLQALHLKREDEPSPPPRQATRSNTRPLTSPTGPAKRPKRRSIAG